MAGLTLELESVWAHYMMLPIKSLVLEKNDKLHITLQ